jgi:hypothetical protein
LISWSVGQLAVGWSVGRHRRRAAAALLPALLPLLTPRCTKLAAAAAKLATATTPAATSRIIIPCVFFLFWPVVF